MKLIFKNRIQISCHITSQRKCNVRKWTGGDENAGNKQGRKGKEMEKKFRRMGLSSLN